MLGLHLGMTNGNPVLGGGSLPLLAATNRGKVPNTTRVASAGNLVCAETRVNIVIGNADLSEIRVVYVGYYINTADGAETSPGNSQQIEAALEISGATHQFTFGGQLVGTITNGIAEYVSDPIYPAAFGLSKFSKGGSYFLRSRNVVTAGQSHTRTTGGNSSGGTPAGESTRYSDGLSASQLLGTGAMSTPTGGVNAGAEVLPAAILGRALGAPDIAVLAVGDSLMQGEVESVTAGSGVNDSGYIARGLYSVSGRTVPMTKMTCGGTTAQQFVASHTKRSALFKYFTHAVCNFGTNDSVTSGRSAAQVLADLRTIWGAFKGAGSRIRHIEQVGIIPRTTSTDSFATVVNQTPRTGFETGGAFRDALNASLLANVGSNGLDAYRDISSYFADGTALDKWAVGKTTDGVHAPAAPNAAAAAAVITWAESWV